MVYFIFIATAFVFWYQRMHRNSVVQVKYKYKLFTLRDKLREQAIEGTLSKDSVLFDYLDESICKLVSALPTLNIYYTIFLFMVYRKDSRFIEFKGDLDKSLKDDPEMMAIYNEFGYLIMEFMEARHPLFFGIIKGVIVSVVLPYFIFKRARKFVSESTNELRLYPETSAARLA